jgi:hypothetical protein
MGLGVVVVSFVSGPAVFLHESTRRLLNLFRKRFIDVDAIDDTDNGSFDRHVLITDGRSRCFAKCAHDHFAGPGSQSIGNHNDIARRFFVEVVRMNNQKPDALEIGRLLRRPDRTYDFG